MCCNIWNASIVKRFQIYRTAMLATRTPFLTQWRSWYIHKTCIWYICSERSLYYLCHYSTMPLDICSGIDFTKYTCMNSEQSWKRGLFLLAFLCIYSSFLIKEPLLDSVQRKTWCLRSALYFSSFFSCQWKTKHLKESKTFSLCIALRKCASLFLSMPPAFESFLI